MFKKLFEGTYLSTNLLGIIGIVVMTGVFSVLFVAITKENVYERECEAKGGKVYYHTQYKQAPAAICIKGGETIKAK